MTWDPDTLQWLDADGNPVPDADLRSMCEDYITAQKAEVDRKSKMLMAGLMSVPAFFDYMKAQVTAWSKWASALAWGRPADPSPAQRYFLINLIGTQEAYLNDFRAAAEASSVAAQSVARTVATAVGAPHHAEAAIQRTVFQTAPSRVGTAVADIINKAPETQNVDADIIDSLLVPTDIDSLLGNTVASRARSYADSAYSTFINSTTLLAAEAGVALARRVCEGDDASCAACVREAARGYLPLDEIPEIGSLTCHNNCRCYLEYWNWHSAGEKSLKGFDPSEQRDERGRWTSGSPMDASEVYANLKNPEMGRELMGGPASHPEWGISEHDAFQEYMNYGAAQVNRDLREGASTGMMIDNMDRIFSRAEKLPQDVSVYRGIRARPSEKHAEMLTRLFGKTELKPGDEFTEKAYLSTTTNKDTAFSFADANEKDSRGPDYEVKRGAVIRFDMPKGMPALRGRSDEYEIMFPRGVKFRVESVRALKQAKYYQHIDSALVIVVKVTL